MAEDLRDNLKRLARNAELRATESLLRWKYKKEGKVLPDQQDLEFQTRHVTEEAHRIITKRGKALLRGLKESLGKKETGEDP